jgi:hypothetical protein
LGTILYFIVCAVIVAGFFHLGITRGFTDTLDISFVALLWVFVVFAMKTRLINVTPRTPLPLTNLPVKIDGPKLLRALVLAGLAMLWTGAPVWFVHQHQWDDSWYGLCLVFIPMVVFLGLFMSSLAQGFAVNFRRR